MNLNKIKYEWFGNVRGDILSGLVVGLALIPEAIAFSIIAGVPPMIGLYASFCIAFVIALVGGRPAMISAATGATALLMGGLVRGHGLQYLLAATILTGIIQIILGSMKISRLMKFIPRSVMVGFVNALAILIFMAQLPHFKGATWVMYAMVTGGLAIIYLFPRVTKVVPSPLVAIIVVTIIAVATGAHVRTVGDLGQITPSLPSFLLPHVPMNFETLAIIFPYSFGIALVGLIESLLTAQIVDDFTDTDSDKNKEARGQGMANIVSGLFGGMAGCAMIGQSGINVRSGGRGRLSTFVAAVFLMVLIVALNHVLVKIPMAALVSVMIMVCIGTFDWSSLTKLHILPKTDSAVMIITVITVVATNNLSIGVLVGVILSAVFFAVKISKIEVKLMSSNSIRQIYKVTGQLFFASVTDFVNAFDFKENVKEIVIDLSHAHIWDDTAVGAIDKVIIKYKEHGTRVIIDGLNQESYRLVEKISVLEMSKVLGKVVGE
ncbi:SulP family inorganic anion transporter [Heyndrickxia acidicola]|uniref:SulP family inorganic anion transporter n=1 Tax=Heyndrickxia acidicola TaxID=209389 RepID=A0ABU6MCX6_9BACI|nr:SulP family inorganic anion transporter [Heyndrickxia acidicola]MED1202370.1 SulP family inorganic anion transporter [Heyndrickxia acidicola]